MTALEARDQLAMLAQAKANPTLCPPELDYCLARARVCDPHGNAPTSPDWCGTWNFNLAAREAWELKANKCANYHDVTIDGRTFAAEQVFKHCQAQADRYRKRLAGTIQYDADWWDGGLPLVCNCDAI
jgi:hypothetical protein